jgi:hypothetical protein
LEAAKTGSVQDPRSLIIIETSSSAYLSGMLAKKARLVTRT